jgi:hypothetical protein
MMAHDPESTVYRFRWSNLTLATYLENRKFVAQALRRDAEILMKRAEQIDAEMSELRRSLEEVPGDEMMAAKFHTEDE